MWTMALPRGTLFALKWTRMMMKRLSSWWFSRGTSRTQSIRNSSRVAISSSVSRPSTKSL
jgi:hypothetical protein